MCTCAWLWVKPMVPFWLVGEFTRIEGAWPLVPRMVARLPHSVKRQAQGSVSKPTKARESASSRRRSSQGPVWDTDRAHRSVGWAHQKPVIFQKPAGVLTLTHLAVGQHQWNPPILVGIGECTTRFRKPILVVGLNRMFTGGQPIWILTHGHV